MTVSGARARLSRYCLVVNATRSVTAIPDLSRLSNWKPQATTHPNIGQYAQPILAHDLADFGLGPAGFFVSCGIGSQQTLRWRRQSRANPSLEKAEFPVSRENTGNFRYYVAIATSLALQFYHIERRSVR